MAKHEIGCAINPACGNEEFTVMEKAKRPCGIAVVGGGPAGMEAARHAALRGHKVTIFERSAELGGAILGDCLVPGKGKMKWYADWIRRQIAKFPNITVQLRREPAAEELKAFDIVLNATGASSYVPEMTAGAERVVPFEKVLSCPKVNCDFNPKDRKPQKLGDKVLIWGDHYAAADTAQYLASIGKQVTIVTENSKFAKDVEVIHMYVAMKRFNLEEAEALHGKPFKHKVNIITSSTVLEAGEGYAVIQDKSFNRQRLVIDDVITCHVRPNVSFMEELRAAGVEFVNVGDSVKPRNLHAAVREGALFGKNIEGGVPVNSNHAPVSGLPLEIEAQLL
jgi:thioredoxin reductase